MSSAQVETLLHELCVVLGFCLPPDEQAHLRESPPTEVDAFTNAVIRAEGLDPHADISLQLRRDVRARVAEHFRKAEDEPQFGQRVCELEDFESLEETAYLMRSPANAK